MMSTYTPRLMQHYEKVVKPALVEQFTYKNVMEIPKVKAIYINMGVGKAVQDGKKLEAATAELTLIAGQKAVVTKAKKSIAGFKLRTNFPIGCRVTLRGQKMYDFLDRLVTIALPRVKDFRGLSAKSFDGNGNYSLGLKEQIVFPEINYDRVDEIRGMDITIVTSARSNDEGKALLKALYLPIQN
ncbi:MAG: 50S ribosomal protein L5 [Alphaproteobacteria bacterium]|nr:50S ribosomal protein L5 [Alphaproteobacteria bacterium]